MTDSPARYPLEPKEQPILDALFRIRNQLELMRTDKSCFIKASAVKELYHDIIPQVHALNDLRAGSLEQQIQQTQGQFRHYGKMDYRKAHASQWMLCSTIVFSSSHLAS
jgi:hypothetical protein